MENKTGRYLKYAMGEIILVVIGILIALQINTWNENRKLENEEINLLNELKSNLETTLEDFQEVTEYNENTVSLYKNINYYVENDLPYHKELDSAFAAMTLWSSPFATTTAYKSLQNKGLDIIKNKHLKNSIIDLYDVQLTSLTVDIEQAEWALNQSVCLPFFSKNIRRLNDVSLNSSSPNNFEALKQNDEFLNIISMLIRQRRKSLEYFEAIMIAIEDVILEIETELKSRT
jgi:hypothetical protein